MHISITTTVAVNHSLFKSHDLAINKHARSQRKGRAPITTSSYQGQWGSSCLHASGVLGRGMSAYIASLHVRYWYQGGFARVYEVKDQQSHHRAVKVISKLSVRSKKNKTKVREFVSLYEMVTNIFSCGQRSNCIKCYLIQTLSDLTIVLRMRRMFTWSWSYARMEWVSYIFWEDIADEVEHDGPTETSEAVQRGWNSVLPCSIGRRLWIHAPNQHHSSGLEAWQSILWWANESQGRGSGTGSSDREPRGSKEVSLSLPGTIRLMYQDDLWNT